MSLISEFKEFLNEYKVMALAVAFIIGVALTALVQSFVHNIIMPLITPLLPGNSWQTSTFAIGPVVFGWGAFLAAAINFIIIAFVVFIMVKATTEKTKKKSKK